MHRTAAEDKDTPDLISMDIRSSVIEKTKVFVEEDPWSITDDPLELKKAVEHLFTPIVIAGVKTVYTAETGEIFSGFINLP
jgi:hypothetical protein